MKFYNEKDMKYWHKQAKLGKAVIIEIPVSMLLDLDISTLSQTRSQVVSSDDLLTWLDENRDEILKELAKEAAEKEEVEKLSQKLYHKEETAVAPEAGSALQAKPAALPTKDTGDTVASIMARETFSDEQIKIIAEAMMEELPDKYMLCFLKKEYPPQIMRQLKDYCTRLYREEMSGND